MISLKTFTGEFPRTTPHLLPDNAATKAVDCDFTANTLTGLNGFGDPSITGVPGVRSAFFYANSDTGALVTKTFAWAGDIDAVRGPVANDAYDRMYWLDGDKLRVTRNSTVNTGDAQPDDNNTFLVGVPVPAAPTIGSLALMYGGRGLTDVVAVCETPSGQIVSAESIFAARTVVQNDANGLSLSFDYRPKCGIYSSNLSSSSNASALPSGFSPVGAVDVWFQAPEYAGQFSTTWFSVTSQPKYNPVGGKFNTIKFSYGGAEYIRYADWQFAPVGDTLYTLDGAAAYVGSEGSILFGLTVQTTPVYTNLKTFTHIGSGWYCTNSQAKPPTGTAANGSTFAVQLYFGSNVVTLRETAGRSKFDIAGYSGEFLLSSGKLTVNLRATAANQALIEQRAYIATFVNIFGEEGAPSPASEVAVPEGMTVPVTMRGPDASEYAPVSKIRLYRTATGANSTEYLFVREFDVASTISFVDSVLSESLGEPVSTLNYFAPERGMSCLRALPNGILVAVKGCEIHFSEPYLPYAWNPANILTTQDECIGVCPTDGGFYVTTRSNPYFVSGVTPDAMSQIKIRAIQAGVSKGSICDIGAGVFYASNDGLVMLRGIDASLEFSGRFFTRKEWRQRYADKLDKMRISAHDGHMLVWFSDGTPGFLIRYDESEPSFTRLSRGIYAAAVHPAEDELYVCLDGTNLVPFRRHDVVRRSFFWRSKEFVLPRPANFGAAQIVGMGEVTVSVFADGELRKAEMMSIDALGNSVFRIPGGFMARRWVVEISGNGEVEEFNLAGSIREFASV